MSSNMLRMHGVCDSCRAPLDVVVSRGGPESRTHPEAHAYANRLGDSYVMLPEKRANGEVPDLSQTLSDVSSGGVLAAASNHEQLRTLSRLLELSDLLNEKVPEANCGVPLCEDCASNVLRELQRRLEEAHAEREMLHTASAELLAGADDEEDADEDASSFELKGGSAPEGRRSDGPLTEEEFARERAVQAEEEEQLRAAIAAAKSEATALDAELARLNVSDTSAIHTDPEHSHPHSHHPLTPHTSHRSQEEWTAQKAAEAERHSAINRTALAQQESAEEVLRAVQLVSECEREIDRLKNVDVLTEVFAIDLDAPIPMINGLRLGRQSGATVEWSELNAALGQVVLLVHTLARLYLPSGGFQHHVLLPHGSLCRVYARKEPNKTFELYGSGRFGTSFFGTGRLDKAQAMLLMCVSEFCAHASAHFNPHATHLSAHPPYSLNELGSLVGPSSAAEGKKFLAVLSWCLSWARAAGGIPKQPTAEGGASSSSGSGSSPGPAQQPRPPVLTDVLTPVPPAPVD